jgi:conjugative relaxase-like TrwC/TraI family protein
VCVLNIGKVLRGKERYLLDQVAGSQRDYYTGAGEAPGQWAGTAAAELDIAGEVDEDGFLRMLNGAHPDTGARLGEPPRGGRVLAYDLTFRAPKSVSLLYAFGGPRVAAAAQEGHARALAGALGYLERQAAIARRGHGGHELVRGDGFIAAVFQHRTSRAGDPLLHSHAVIANLTRRPDGRWTALDGRALWTHAKTAGYLYQAVLRRELTRELGVAWTGYATVSRISLASRERSSWASPSVASRLPSGWRSVASTRPRVPRWRRSTPVCPRVRRSTRRPCGAAGGSGPRSWGSTWVTWKPCWGRPTAARSTRATATASSATWAAPKG